MNGRRVLCAIGSLAIAAATAFPSSAADSCTSVPAIDDRCETWVSIHGTVGSGGEQARDLAVGGGTAFVTGLRHTGDFQYDYLTVAYDVATGAERWTASYDGPFADQDIAWGAAAAPDGSRVYVTGESVGGFETGNDVATLAYDGVTGKQLWEARFDAGSTDSAKGIVLSPNGDTVYVLADISSNTSPNHGLGVLAYDAMTGTPAWTAQVTGTGFVWPAGIALDAAGSRVFVGGWTGGTNADKPRDTDYLLGAFRARDAGGHEAGELLWSARHDGGQGDSEDRLTGLAVSPDGSRVFATGYLDRVSATLFAQYQVGTVAFDGMTGTKVWESSYSTSVSSQGSAVAVSPDGTRLYVTGKTTGVPTGDGLQTGFQILTLAYDAGQGVQLWGVSYDHPGTTDHPTAMALSSDGSKLYVTGWSAPYAFPENNMDAVTVSYDADGTRRWVARYNSSEQNLDGARPWSMIATNDRVLISGGTKRTSTGAALGNYDYLTLAYPA